MIPNKKIFTSEGQYIHILDLPYISIEIEEFSNIVLGTNDNLNKSFANMITTSTNYQTSTSQKFLELKNLTDNPKVFKPSPLNSLNSLTLKIKDNLGNILDYRNQYLNLKNITFIPSEIGVILSTIDDGTNYELTLNIEGEINTVNATNDNNNYLLNGIKTSVDNLNITDLTTTVNQNKLNINHANKKFILIPVISNQININCTDWSETMTRVNNYTDNLIVSVVSKDFVYWIQDLR